MEGISHSRMGKTLPVPISFKYFVSKIECLGYTSKLMPFCVLYLTKMFLKQLGKGFLYMQGNFVKGISFL